MKGGKTNAFGVKNEFSYSGLRLAENLEVSFDALPQRLPRAFRPGPVVVVAADAILAHVGENLTRRRQTFGVDPLVGIPQVGANDGPRALKIDLDHGDHDDRAWRLAVDRKRCQQIRVYRDLRMAVDAQRAAGAWNQKQQRDPGVTHDVAQRIDAVVATAIGHHQRLVVMNADEAGQIAARRAIQPLRSGRCQCDERRLVDQHAILRRHSGGDLDRGGLVRLPINRFQISYRCDDRHCRSPDLGASPTQPLPPASAPLMTRTSSRACCSTLPTLAMVTSGAVAASSTARPSLSASWPSLPRARAARRSARTSAGAVIKITTTSA